ASMNQYLSDSVDLSLMFARFQNSFLSRALSPNLEDSVLFIDTKGIVESAENYDNSSQPTPTSLNNGNEASVNKTNTKSYVYNRFEAHLIVHLVQTMLQIYGGRSGFKGNHIGIISPFQLQVAKI